VLRGVLLTILCFCLLHVNKDELKKIGPDELGEFVHVFEQTILMENWLGRDKFSLQEIKDAMNYFPFTAINLFRQSKGRPKFIFYIIFTKHYSLGELKCLWRNW